MSSNTKEISKIILEKGLTISTCESCTAGGLSYEITKIKGSSKWFVGGLVTYSNFSKSKLLGINISFINIYGAVSVEVSQEMVRSCLNKFKSDLSISITGYAEKNDNNGLVYISIGSRYYLDTFKINVNQSRESNRKFIIKKTIEFLLNFLKKKKILNK